MQRWMKGVLVLWSVLAIASVEAAALTSPGAVWDGAALPVLELPEGPVLVLDVDPAPHWRAGAVSVVETSYLEPLTLRADVNAAVLPDALRALTGAPVALRLGERSLCSGTLDGFALIDRYWPYSEDEASWGVAPVLVATLEVGAPLDCLGATWAGAVTDEDLVSSGSLPNDAQIAQAARDRFSEHMDYVPEFAQQDALEVTVLHHPGSGQTLVWTRAAIHEGSCGDGLWAELGVLWAVESSAEGVELLPILEDAALELEDAVDADGDGRFELFFTHDELETGVPSRAILRSEDDYHKLEWNRVPFLGCSC